MADTFKGIITVDGKKRQLPYESVLKTPVSDKTLSVEGGFADSKIVGNKFAKVNETTDSLKEDLGDVIDKVYPINRFNKDNIKNGYVSTTGESYSSSTYYHYCLNVNEGDIVSFFVGSPPISAYMRFICAYDSSGNPISDKGTENTHIYTVPSEITKIICSADTKKDSLQAIINGEKPTKVNAYFEPYAKIRDSAIIAHVYKNHINVEKDVVESGETLTVFSNIDVRKDTDFEAWANFNTFNSFTIGHGYKVAYGSWIVIDSTDVTVYYGSSQVIEKFTHGLNIDKFIHVLITQNNSARGNITITSASGSFTTPHDFLYHACIGDAFVTGTQKMTGVKAAHTIKDLNKDVFLIGDSYTSMGDPSRYPYYLMNTYKATNLLICGYGGAKSSDEILSFRNLIAIAKPKYLVWALGMNDTDTETSVNASWKACFDEVVETCNVNKITLILATIPNCPKQINMFKNEIVRDSGYRYIDFAKAVGGESKGSNWYEGMLYTDNIHPTQLGAKVLASRFIIDVPEIIN